MISLVLKNPPLLNKKCSNRGHIMIHSVKPPRADGSEVSQVIAWLSGDTVPSFTTA